ncbi:conserved protein of unknown function [Candidatus Filomicrobium marinum]|uniref:Uncharacterized protein n=2 Tax=Filomicrobium TaxID=119044 RepID=A0A0D6JAE3_9HYPH|nr:MULTISPECIES: hypothetical protein [Filomicrobium]MCV0368792.1 hypothetical protein [Filomicrobium sp.]CFW98495.1 conserved protein of unknown function [Candidatus Filomicrobium marinum]CPR14908.1 conserved protein of unknown function [Candidatus Filomicrobium marinum]SDO73594.1 hypothetical protein SAMN04488061_1521 [Filomicrobium insigne]
MPTAEWTDPSIDTSDDTVRALQLILTAWDEGEESGVAPELMAYAAIFAAMTDLVTLFGEDAVAKMAGSLEQRVKLGEFTLRQSRH